MKRKILPIAAVLSVITMTVLAFAYLGAFELDIQLSPLGRSRLLSLITLALDDGRFRVWIQWHYLPQGFTAPFLPRIFHAEARFFPVKFHANRWLTSFDMHAVSSSAYLLSIPAWCPILLCCVAPALWVIRRRSANAAGRGFAVAPSTPAAT